MHPSYLSPKNFAQTQPQNGVSFYNPQKEIQSNFETQAYTKSPTNAQFVQSPFQPISRSYIVKPKYDPNKKNSNNSGYLKPNAESQAPPTINNFSQVYIKPA